MVELERGPAGKKGDGHSYGNKLQKALYYVGDGRRRGLEVPEGRSESLELNWE